MLAPQKPLQIYSASLASAVQMELNFIHRVLFGQQLGNLKAIETLLPQNQNQCQCLLIVPKYNGTECKHLEKVPKLENERHSNGNDKSAREESDQSQHKQKGVGRPKRYLSECQVCGRQCQYRYYNVKCCESCKQFFRRVVAKRTLFNCIGGKNCQIDKNGSRCRGCRLDKCLLVGMDPTMVNVKRKDGFDQFLAMMEQRIIVEKEWHGK
ncbi:hypothetical protein niasHT_001006 [Heterodera trifolii]|uniref:Nuclear receptor domain-containing protein n=1 Tax=Heterodera trifolii TaxID=157864 RepID=A0ABD2LSZ5_9BILA